jgi:hypothetical protein
MPDVLALLIEERDRLNRAIDALQMGTRRRGRPPGSGKAAASKPAKRRKRKTMSSEARKAVSERMRKYWAARRKGKKK